MIKNNYDKIIKNNGKELEYMKDNVSRRKCEAMGKKSKPDL